MSSWPRRESISVIFASMAKENMNWKEIIEDTTRKAASPLTVENCREINQALQLQQPLWKLLKKIKRVGDNKNRLEHDLALKQNIDLAVWEKHLETLRSDLKRMRDRCANLIQSKNEAGPVGNFPIHDCILHNQIDLAEELIKENPALGECTYGNDMTVWKDAGIQIDEGLYTGETVLHLAIGMGHVKLVEALLENVDPIAEVKGLFFLPPWIPYTKPSLLQKLANPFGRPLRFNSCSRCYFGAYPLSFAASVGSPEMCSLVLDAICRRDKNVNKALLIADDYGNTALHMAVMHRQGRVIDWILEKDDGFHVRTGTRQVASKGKARESKATDGERGAKMAEKTATERGRLLDAMNKDGLTALTLAARLGSVKEPCALLFIHPSSLVRSLVSSLPFSLVKNWGKREGEGERDEEIEDATSPIPSPSPLPPPPQNSLNHWPFLSLASSLFHLSLLFAPVYTFPPSPRASFVEEFNQILLHYSGIAWEFGQAFVSFPVLSSLY